MDNFKFDQINATWLAYDEHGEVQERSLEDICKFYGVTVEEYQAELARRTS